MLSQKQFEPILNKLIQFSGVSTVIIANEEGFPLAFRSNRDTFTSEEAEAIAALLVALLGRATSSLSQFRSGRLNSITMDIQGGEILIAVEDDYIVIALRGE